MLVAATRGPVAISVNCQPDSARENARRAIAVACRPTLAPGMARSIPTAIAHTEKAINTEVRDDLGIVPLTPPACFCNAYVV